MHRLRIISAGDVIADWPIHVDVDCANLARAIAAATMWLRRFGRVLVTIEAPDGVNSIIARWS